MTKGCDSLPRRAPRIAALHILWAALLAVALTGTAQAQVTTQDCLDCHDDKDMRSDDGRMVGVPAAWFTASIHGDLDCVDCHTAPGDYEDTPHYQTYTPVSCDDCHDPADHAFNLAAHDRAGGKKAPTCLECHAVDADPHRIHAGDDRTAQMCMACHKEVKADFAGSVHEYEIESGDMTCLSCHARHMGDRESSEFDPGCGECHDDINAEYKISVHWDGRQHGNFGAATCVDCHTAHTVLAVADTTALVNPANVPTLCSKCHAGDPVVTADYVRLPVAVPNYMESVHGREWKRNGGHPHEGERWNRGVAAVCTDCHGVHDLRHADDPKSSTHWTNIATTCGACHDDIAGEYKHSIHGKAVALGLKDSPTCTSCHDEHLIRTPRDPEARISPEHRSKELCGDCHTNRELLAKYGVRGGVLESYLDSYHGWAVNRGSQLAADCVDCHNVHDIRSPLDPTSSVNAANVTGTCGRCHENSNAAFAQSYTHKSAIEARAPHEWARLIYIILIAVVLGGMAIHNAIVARYELRQHFDRRRREAYVQRWWRAERVQHMVLLLSFTGLAITGFALRFPDSWWVRLIGLSGHEGLRANLHRSLAIILSFAAVYHVFWVSISRRGRLSIAKMAPRYSDVVHAMQNMAFHLGLRRERPHFDRFDYTQKAEYWAVIWGTIVMAITGAVLWWPTLATGWLPAWVVRVSEVVHFYEAVLAVSAIVIWHFFYVIFMPSEYPVSTIWLNGRMPADEWKELHRREYEEVGAGAVRHPNATDTISPNDVAAAHSKDAVGESGSEGTHETAAGEGSSAPENKGDAGRGH